MVTNRTLCAITDFYLFLSLSSGHAHKLIHAHAQAASHLHKGIHKMPFINRRSGAAELTLHVFRKMGGGEREGDKGQALARPLHCEHPKQRSLTPCTYLHLY